MIDVRSTASHYQVNWIFTSARSITEFSSFCSHYLPHHSTSLPRLQEAASSRRSTSLVPTVPDVAGRNLHYAAQGSGSVATRRFGSVGVGVWSWVAKGEEADRPRMTHSTMEHTAPKENRYDIFLVTICGSLAGHPRFFLSVVCHFSPGV